jgi:NADH:ubiquinone oxidoreductase subunit 5 (subunit L)/multisubunit Na+/H+ antiporter MnhA subunit
MTATLNPAAPHHLPAFITAPGESDILMTVMAVFLIIAVLAVGLLFLRLHTLPERMAHRSHKLQFEIVAVLGLLALFTHMHIFWVAGLLLALIDIPDFGNPLRRIAGSVEKIAGLKPGEGAALEPEEVSGDIIPIEAQGEGAVEVPKTIPLPRMPKERTHA